ncbi:hypothetical protein [Brevibacillus reuszeri]|uniref:hypothetical protein n=1 Tax=Brevibacillus reuszeri TaxID=54915 RepID=UPI003D1C7E02
MSPKEWWRKQVDKLAAAKAFGRTHPNDQHSTITSDRIKAQLENVDDLTNMSLVMGARFFPGNDGR